MKVTYVRGLIDGQHTAGTLLLIRKIRELGASAVVAKTGRVTLTTPAGERRVYALEIDPRYREFSEADYRNANSPLKQALQDVVTAPGR